MKLASGFILFSCLHSGWAQVIQENVSATQGYSDRERRPNCIPPTHQFGAFGSVAGRFLQPGGMAIDQENRIFVVDTGSHRIQVLTLDGTPIRQWGEPGSLASQFLFPMGIALGPGGEIYVADCGNHRIQVFDAEGKFLRQWGKHGVAAGEFSSPRWLVVQKNRVFVSESDLPRVQEFTRAGEWVREFVASTSSEGALREPAGIAADESGNVYLADAGGNFIQKFDREGKPAVRWGMWGAAPGLLSAPTGIAWLTGKLFVADSGNHRIQVFDGSGTFLFQWGRHPALPHEGKGRFHFPAAIATSPSGSVIAVGEPFEHRVQVFTEKSPGAPKQVNDNPWWETPHGHRDAADPHPLPPSTQPAALLAVPEPQVQSLLVYDAGAPTITMLARFETHGAKLGEFHGPVSVVSEGSGNRFFVLEKTNRRIQLIEVPRDSKASNGLGPEVRAISAWDLATLVPRTLEGWRPERLVPAALALAPRGGFYVVDEGNSRVLAFDGKMKFVRMIRPPKHLESPSRFIGVAAGPDGKAIYVADRDGARVLAFDVEGRFLFAWGKRGSEGEAAFLSPSGIAVDAEGSVFVTDSLLHQVRHHDAWGKSLMNWGSFGDQPREFRHPQRISILGPGRVLIDDFGNHRGQVFSPDGRLLETFFKGEAPQSSRR